MRKTILLLVSLLFLMGCVEIQRSSEPTSREDTGPAGSMVEAPKQDKTVQVETVQEAPRPAMIVPEPFTSERVYFSDCDGFINTQRLTAPDYDIHYVHDQPYDKEIPLPPGMTWCDRTTTSNTTSRQNRYITSLGYDELINFFGNTLPDARTNEQNLFINGKPHPNLAKITSQQGIVTIHAQEARIDVE